jgi:hypothetical protein
MVPQATASMAHLKQESLHLLQPGLQRRGIAKSTHSMRGNAMILRKAYLLDGPSFGLLVFSIWYAERVQAHLR